ncbi:MAG: cupin domain-containing protein [Betaproteobacteria bacterium]|nr:cupin domain-containing protein [Betaproteobacteria bacterium]
METGMTPIRRVVTGNDERGRSKVVWDGPAPQVHGTKMSGRGHTDFWVWEKTPAPLSGESDDGLLPDEFPGPRGGGHLRVVHWLGQNDPASKGAKEVPFHESKERPRGRTWDRGGGNEAYSSAMHKTESVDYGIMLSGERKIRLDDVELTMQPGDIVIQVGAWHQWNSARLGCLMAFDMISAQFVDRPAGTAQGNDVPMRADPNRKLPAGVKPARRIVTIDRETGKSSLVGDGPSPDVRTDPARPGFAWQRMWVTDSTPAKIVFETLHLPHVLEPPANGSVLSVATFPPDSTWKGRVGEAGVKAFFRSMGSPGASTYSAQAPHPYMQKTRTLDFCCILEGEITLVLDTQEVQLKAGEIVVQRGTNHAWSNRSDKPAVVAIASHDGKH